MVAEKHPMLSEVTTHDRTWWMGGQDGQSKRGDVMCCTIWYQNATSKLMGKIPGIFCVSIASFAEIISNFLKYLLKFTDTTAPR